MIYSFVNFSPLLTSTRMYLTAASPPLAIPLLIKILQWFYFPLQTPRLSSYFSDSPSPHLGQRSPQIGKLITITAAVNVTTS